MLGATLKVETSRQRDGPRSGGGFRSGRGGNFRGRGFSGPPGGGTRSFNSYGGGRPYNRYNQRDEYGSGGSNFRSRSPLSRY